MWGLEGGSGPAQCREEVARKLPWAAFDLEYNTFDVEYSKSRCSFQRVVCKSEHGRILPLGLWSEWQGIPPVRTQGVYSRNRGGALE